MNDILHLLAIISLILSSIYLGIFMGIFIFGVMIKSEIEIYFSWLLLFAVLLFLWSSAYFAIHFTQ